MSYFAKAPEDQRAEAERRLEAAESLLKAAESAYRRDSSRANLISLKAATRLAKESMAQAQEWFDD